MFGFLTARYRRFLVAFFIFLISVYALFFVVPYVLVAYRTAYIISHILPSVPQWFEWGSYKVELREEILSGQADPGNIDLYLPRGVEKSSFILFFPGFNPDGYRDPRLVNLAKAFAGAGIGVAVPDSENIRNKRFSRDDIDLIKDTFYFLKKQPYADPARIGLSGFSIAGSYSLRAASELGDNPLFVHSLGGYYDLEELFKEVISGKVVYGGQERPWQPDFLSKELASKATTTQINADKISPASVLGNMKTRVFLMHDKNDNLIPVEESRKIRDALPKDIYVSYSEFALLRHVTPQSVLSPDVIRFSGQVLSIVKLLSWK